MVVKMNLEIRKAVQDDALAISLYDKWCPEKTIIEKIEKGEIFAVYNDDVFVGWLRYGFFWDNTPFMYMLHLLPEYRGKGIGKKLVGYWEAEMKKTGYNILLTSTAQTETAQHFYEKLGYKAIGSFILESEPKEILFSKKI